MSAGLDQVIVVDAFATAIPEVVPLAEASIESVAVMLCVPADRSVRLNVWTPASATVKV